MYCGVPRGGKLSATRHDITTALYTAEIMKRGPFRMSGTKIQEASDWNDIILWPDVTVPFITIFTLSSLNRMVKHTNDRLCERFHLLKRRFFQH
jgi:hypothetical protein